MIDLLKMLDKASCAEVEEMGKVVLQALLAQSDHGLIIKVGDQKVWLKHVTTDDENDLYIPQDIKFANASEGWLYNYKWD